MKALIVDDADYKSIALSECIKAYDSNVDICRAKTAQEAMGIINGDEIELVLLDILLPLSPGDAPSEDASVWLIREIHRKIASSRLPLIVGTTQYPDSLAKVVDTFREYLWSVILISESDARWRRQITHAVRFISSKTMTGMLSNSKSNCDVGIVTALRMPEFEEVVDALGGGSSYRIIENNELWLHCTLSSKDGRELSVFAACADEMGMSPMSSLVTRVCITCKPNNLILAGIMGGNEKRVSMSDIILIEESWDCHAGKITEHGFEADVKSQRCDYKLLNTAKGSLDEALLSSMWSAWKGSKPPQFPQLHSGAVACSPAVIANAQVFSELETQKRKVLGVEMEAYGCYNAVHYLGDIQPRTLSIKSVCDLGNKEKSEQFQRYCAYLSAAATIQIITNPNFLN